MIHLSWDDVAAEAMDLRDRLPMGANIYGIPRGGSIVAGMLAVQGMNVVTECTPDAFVIDDLVDSGKTLIPFHRKGHQIDALYRKPHSPWCPRAKVLPPEYVVFPWEVGTHDEWGPQDAVVRLLEHIGEDPTRDGLKDTPGRVLKAWTEMTAGYKMIPQDILARNFEVGYDEIVIVRAIPFWSTCEHHLLPFTGTADVGYLPLDHVVGLSKLVRLVECFAKRLQVQERMTRQIGDAIMTCLNARGAAVILRATHACMGCRGVRTPTAETVTSAMLGAFQDDPAARAEFLALIRGA